VPEVPPTARANSVNDVYVDENRIVYAVDRLKGGLYILELNIWYRQVYLVENFLPLHMTIGRVRIRAVAHSCKVWGLLMLRVWRIKSRIRRFIASTLPVVVGRFNFGYFR
jgi:hypothetical protein